MTQLISFIHDIGRILPENRREDFLKRLKAIGEESAELSEKDDVKDVELQETYQRVCNNLKKIDSQEVMISGILNTQYDEWYDDEDEEYIYEDDDGVSDMITEACGFVHICMDMEKHKEGFEVGRQLFAMEILCTNDYGGEEFSIGDMVNYELVSCDLKHVILDTLYCAYHSAPLEERPEVLYEVIANAGRKEITLEAIMQHGDEDLPDFQDFLILWIAYLGDKTGRDADRLIVEAVNLLNDVSLAVKYAERFAEVHPGLYLNILENEKATDGNAMVSIGIKALETVPKQYVMRSRIALKTAEYVMKANGEPVFRESRLPQENMVCRNRSLLKCRKHFA